MKLFVRHEIPGRIRVHVDRKSLTFKQADVLEYYLAQLPGVKKAKVYERTADAVIVFDCPKGTLIAHIQQFHFEEVTVPAEVLENSGRELNAYYKEKLITQICVHYAKRIFLPAPVRWTLNVIKAVKFIVKGIKSLINRRLDVAVLDAAAITMSIIQGDFSTAGSVMFLLNIGDTIEEWTHKKSISDLARSMALKVEKVWLKTESGEVLVPTNQIREGDRIVVRMGNMIPFDGEVISGDGSVNQSAMTGEPLSVAKSEGGTVFAGTVLEEGELVIRVKQTSGSSRYEKIISVIEETEKLKSATESRTEHLADRLVPWTFAGTGLTWLITRNITKTMSVLMVDFSCALKLSMPITVLSAIREAGEHHITVKGGKFLEAVADATTIVFDKTGTLTKAMPRVNRVYSFCDMKEDELLRIAACLEEHFPHSIARAVVRAAEEKALVHEEMHADIEYIVAHGIASSIDGKKVVLGSYHFVFEDEGCKVDGRRKGRLASMPEEYTKLFMAIDGKLAAVICIEDPIREDAADTVRRLKEAGFEKIVMMTGDNQRTARSVCERIGIDEFYAGVLPEQKAEFVKKEKEKGRTVIMVGDGINDSPALSAADAGVAISDGAEIAREIADITISSDDLETLVTLKKISTAMMNRVKRNYRLIVGINGALIVLGVAGIITPALSATLHNLSTIGISVSGMMPLLDK